LTTASEKKIQKRRKTCSVVRFGFCTLSPSFLSRRGYSVDLLAPATPARNGNFIAKVSLPSFRVDTAEIVTAQSSNKVQIWDNRDLKEFTGEELKKGAYRAGRIPGSSHSNWVLFKKKENQAEWLTASEFQPVLHKLGYDRSKEQYFYCQSGVRSTQALFALCLLSFFY
jgi:thiosulfate/3-mercaptopyruvate sulfurtransferase